MTTMTTRRLGRIAAAALLLASLAYALLTLLRPAALGLDSILAVMRMATRSLAMTATAVLLLRPGMKPQNVFALLAALFGLCYVFMVVPLATPDEQTHYRFALTVASRVMNGSCAADSTYMNFAGLTPHENTPDALLTFMNGLSSGQIAGDMAAFDPVAVHDSMIYLPQILSVMLGMTLRLNLYWIFVLGSVVNLGIYIALVYMALRILPRGKVPSMLCALVPTALQQAASYSTDGLVTGLAFLLIALIFRAYEQAGAISGKELLKISLVCALLAPAKAVYTLLLLLLFLIPGKRFRSGKQRWGFIAAVFAVSFLLTFLYQLSWLQEMIAGTAQGTNEYYTVGWLLAHPVDLVRIVMKSLFPFGVFFYIETAVGSFLAGLNLEVHKAFIWIMLMMITASAVCLPEGEKPLKAPVRAICGSLAAMVMLACAATMLIGWTVEGDELIQGVQGRYLHPVAPLIMLAMGGSNFTSKRDMTPVWQLGFVVMNLLVLNDVINHFAGLTF